MHIHGNQFAPRNDIYALLSAAKTEAKKEAERTRRKLLNAASSLAGEYEDCVVRLSGDDAGRQHGEAQGGKNEDGQNPDEEVAAVSGEDALSRWA